jgi:tetratricopeptide (TPR) repeat protein
MYASGVVCTHCHDAHSLALRPAGDAVCGQCHTPERYQSDAHHHHDGAGAGSACVDCHMPTTVFMQIDRRRDHAFRVPRPDLTLALGTPNVCNDCHRDRDAAWARDAVLRWRPTANGGYQRFAETLVAARRSGQRARALLLSLVDDARSPPIARATAASHLGDYTGGDVVRALRELSLSDDPLLRLGAALGARTQELAASVLPALLDDPILSVRTAAVRRLAPLPEAAMSPAVRSALDAAAAEFFAIARRHADRPEWSLAAGVFHTDRGRLSAAVRTLEDGVRRFPDFGPLYVNLADVYRMQQRDGQTVELLRRGVGAITDDAALHHALGLAYVRRGDTLAAVDAFAQAVGIDATNAHYRMVYALALDTVGRRQDAVTQLEAAAVLDPDNPSITQALRALSP